MTRLLDLYPYDRPSQILLTTFDHQLRIYSKEEIEEGESNHLIGYSPFA
jgi:hypothetical protein